MCFYTIDLLIVEVNSLENLKESGKLFPGSCCILDIFKPLCNLNLCMNNFNGLFSK